MNLLHLLKNLEIPAAADKAPPKEFRIFPMGEVETTKGTYTVDAKSSENMLGIWKSRGIKLGGDYEHASLSDPPPATGAPSPMWYDLEARADGVYATNVEWTPRAAEYLKNGEYKYFSPAFASMPAGDDSKSRRVTRLVNIALTNLPATNHMDELVAASAVDRRTVKLSSELSFDQVRQLLETALRMRFMDGWPCILDVYDESVVFALGQKTLQAPYLVDGSTAVIGDPIAVQRTYTPVASSGGEEMVMKTLLKQLGLAETATETEAVVALNAERKTREDAHAEITKLTSTKSQGEAVGTIAAWKASHEQVEKLSAKVKELEAATTTREVEQLVAEGTRDGKIPPAMKDFWLEQGKKDVVALKTFLEKAPKLVSTEPREPNKNEGELVTLDADEKLIAKNMGLKESDYLDVKKKHAAQQAEQKRA